jgi:hypothetical protein
LFTIDSCLPAYWLLLLLLLPRLNRLLQPPYLKRTAAVGLQSFDEAKP